MSRKNSVFNPGDVQYVVRKVTGTCGECGKPFEYEMTTKSRLYCAPCKTQRKKVQSSRRHKQRKKDTKTQQTMKLKLIPYAGYDDAEGIVMRGKFYKDWR